MAELEAQWPKDDSVPLDHVVFACGSGGTAAGIAVGLCLCESLSPIVHAVGVCDDPDYFYSYVAGIADDMGLLTTAPTTNDGNVMDGNDDASTTTTEDFVRECMTVHQGKGLGYASSTPEELDFVTRFAVETGITLDPVYSGKALYHFVEHVLPSNPEAFRGKNVLFWHTGGALGMYDKGDDLPLSVVSKVKRLDVYGNKGKEGVDPSRIVDISD